MQTRAFNMLTTKQECEYSDFVSSFYKKEHHIANYFQVQIKNN